jgi:FkbM family methyltransferase
MPSTDGPSSTIEYDFGHPVYGLHQIEIDADEVLHSDGRCVLLKCQINGIDCETRKITGAGLTRLRYDIDFNGSAALIIKLQHSGLPALERVPRPVHSIKSHQSVLKFRSIGVSPVETIVHVADSLCATKNDTVHTGGSIVSFNFRGTPLNFFVHDPHDSIQAHHAAGELYELEELDLLAQHIKPGSRILDIGANIGNHTVWFEKVAQASLIVPVEPQLRMIKLLKLNCMLNELTRVELIHLGFALGSSDTLGSVRIPHAFNPAGAVIDADGAGEIQILVGDATFPSAIFDFLKIDVEGAELDVIKGLQALIRRCKPMMFVEVWDTNALAFATLLEQMNYEIIAEYRRYDIANNLLIRHKELVPSS